MTCWDKDYDPKFDNNGTQKAERPENQTFESSVEHMA